MKVASAHDCDTGLEGPNDFCVSLHNSDLQFAVSGNINDFSPLDGMQVHFWVTDQNLIRSYLFIHLGGERHCES